LIRNTKPFSVQFERKSKKDKIDIFVKNYSPFGRVATAKKQSKKFFIVF